MSVRSAMTDSTLVIREVAVRAVVAPMRLPLRTSTGALTAAPLVLIDVHTSAARDCFRALFRIGSGLISVSSAFSAKTSVLSLRFHFAETELTAERENIEDSTEGAERIQSKELRFGFTWVA